MQPLQTYTTTGTGARSICLSTTSNHTTTPTYLRTWSCRLTATASAPKKVEVDRSCAVSTSNDVQFPFPRFFETQQHQIGADSPEHNTFTHTIQNFWSYASHETLLHPLRRLPVRRPQYYKIDHQPPRRETPHPSDQKGPSRVVCNM